MPNSAKNTSGDKSAWNFSVPVYVIRHTCLLSVHSPCGMQACDFCDKGHLKIAQHKHSVVNVQDKISAFNSTLIFKFTHHLYIVIWLAAHRARFHWEVQLHTEQLQHAYNKRIHKVPDVHLWIYAPCLLAPPGKLIIYEKKSMKTNHTFHTMKKILTNTWPTIIIKQP